MTKFERFKKKNLDKIVSANKVNSKFVVKGFPTTTITFADGSTKTVSVVNKQEQEMAYIYTKQNEPLNIGDSFSCKDLHFIIAEHITIIKDVDFNKYIALLCNVDLGNGQFGYFKGPEKSYINLTLKRNQVVFSQQKPLLVVKQGTVKVGETIKIKNRPWLVIEADLISDDYIGYYSLKPTTDLKEDNTPVKPAEIIPNNAVKDGSTITLSTEEAFFESSANVDNLSLGLKKVTFTIPYGLKELVVKTKEQGEIKETKYSIR